MMNRRTMLIAAFAGTLAPVTRALADGGMSRISAYAFSFPALSGGDIRLAAFTGKPLLVVNTASLCGYTPQYAGLQDIWGEFRERGLTVIGVPSNDFGGQEPGGTSEISETAHHQYGVTFPIAAKAVVVGAKAHPFYKWAAEARPREVPRWNFHKYLIGPKGELVGYFGSKTAPDAAELADAIDKVVV
jgi:glutathione peroxidase